VLKGSKQLVQKSWDYVNEAYKTVCVVQFPPNVIASACIYLAARVLNYPLPIDPSTNNHLPWWTILGVTFDDMTYVAASIHELNSFKSAGNLTLDYVE
jgi:hypothetical protein